jgi:hypothetical protein
MRLWRRLHDRLGRTRGSAIPGLLPFLLVALILLLRPLAAAYPPDPVWIHGIYDDADLDDIVIHIDLLSSVCDSPGPHLLVPGSQVEPLPLARQHPVTCEGRGTFRDRAPPSR